MLIAIAALVAGFIAWRQKRVAQAALSQSDFLQALRSINEGKDYDALDQLTHSLSFNADNQAAVCRLITLLTYREYATPLLRLEHDQPVYSAQFSPDGKRIVTASEDATARIWDAQTGKPLTEPMKHDKEVWSVQFSPDGKRIVTASEDRTARIWDISPTRKTPPEWLLRLADAVAGQCLNDRGVFEPLSEDSVDVLNQVKDQLSHEAADDDLAIWGRWFLADRSARTISPFSKLTVPEYIENRIRENTSVSLDEAEELAVGNAQLLERIRHAREALKQKAESPAQP